LLCSLLHSPVILSLLGPNILLSTVFSKNSQPTFLPQCGIQTSSLNQLPVIKYSNINELDSMAFRLNRSNAAPCGLHVCSQGFHRTM
jgi:hypothetical protein